MKYLNFIILMFLCQNILSQTHINTTIAQPCIQANVSILNESIDLVEIYPNPSKGVFNVKINSNRYSSISIFDIKGKKVQEKQLDDSQLITMNIESLKEGTYFIIIKNEEFQSIDKLVLIK